jgi:hypothetical protein
MSSSKDITIKLHVASVTEHGAGGGYDVQFFQAIGDADPYTGGLRQPEVSLRIHSTDKLIELGYYEMTLRKVE